MQVAMVVLETDAIGLSMAMRPFSPHRLCDAREAFTGLSPFPIALLSPLKKESMCLQPRAQQNCSNMPERCRLLRLDHKNDKGPRPKSGAGLSKMMLKLVKQTRPNRARNFTHCLQYIFGMLFHRVAFDHHVTDFTIGLQKLTDDVDVVR